jgi:transcriptional regulator
MTDERRKAAASVRIQRENVSKVMEEVRCNATKANVVIRLAMSGKMPLQVFFREGERERERVMFLYFCCRTESSIYNFLYA